MAGKKTVGAAALDNTALFEQELQARNEDLRRQAAVTMFVKLRPSNKVSVEEFLSGLKQHKDVWSVVSTMGILDFASTLTGGPKESEPKAAKAAKGGKRTRLSEAQKNSLKGLIVNVLAGVKDGLSRAEIASHSNEDLLGNIGVNRDDLADKLRQPLGELVRENKIHTVGEKRLMKYFAGPDAKKK